MMPSTLATVLGTAAILLLQAIFVGGSIYIIYRLAKRRSADGTQEPIRTDTEGGEVIPIIAAFAGVRGLPWWFALASNKPIHRWSFRVGHHVSDDPTIQAPFR